MPKVRIAFLLTLNGRAVRQVHRLLKFLYSDQHYYYIHIDSVSIKQLGFKQKFICNSTIFLIFQSTFLAARLFTQRIIKIRAKNAKYTFSKATIFDNLGRCITATNVTCIDD